MIILMIVFDDNFSYFSSKPSDPSQDGSDEGSQHIILCRTNKNYP